MWPRIHLSEYRSSSPYGKTPLSSYYKTVFCFSGNLPYEAHVQTHRGGASRQPPFPTENRISQHPHTHFTYLSFPPPSRFSSMKRYFVRHDGLPLRKKKNVIRDLGGHLSLILSLPLLALSDIKPLGHRLNKCCLNWTGSIQPQTPVKKDLIDYSKNRMSQLWSLLHFVSKVCKGDFQRYSLSTFSALWFRSK